MKRSVHTGDLGAIEKQYDIAISTACGPLDYIVVDDTATAQRCVELLRKQKLGVATFLLLDKQAHLARAASEKVTPPEGYSLPLIWSWPEVLLPWVKDAFSIKDFFS